MDGARGHCDEHIMLKNRQQVKKTIDKIQSKEDITDCEFSDAIQKSQENCTCPVFRSPLHSGHYSFKYSYSHKTM